MYKGYLIHGAGLAGQVLHRELGLRGISSRLKDTSRFPRDKVCGGVLQPDSWEYLNRIFKIQAPYREIHSISHFWKKTRLSCFKLKKPLIFIARISLDHTLYRQHDQLDQAQADGQWCEIHAHGIGRQKGEWMGFQARTDQVQHLSMYYAPHIYLGLAPTTDGYGHAAILVKRQHFKGILMLKREVEVTFGLTLSDPVRGTGPIHYGYGSGDLAVGDAKLKTHPFLGLGMKHAILSSRLMADAIEKGELENYSKRHRRIFRQYAALSHVSACIYAGPWRVMAWPLVKCRWLFMPAYTRLHASAQLY